MMSKRPRRMIDLLALIHNLGHGLCSTVWIARDTRLGLYFSLKMLSANPQIPKIVIIITKFGFLECLVKRRSSGGGHVEWKYVASELLCHFRVEGPNGRHLVLVLPVYGPIISPMSRWTTRIRKSVVRKMALQATQGDGVFSWR